ncbi:MAG: hypothetical protein HY909_10780 [Deltaproteobacteria bacterium]|nr:hypothetical protein [Deltaproteobacteria bacterium]
MLRGTIRFATLGVNLQRALGSSPRREWVLFTPQNALDYNVVLQGEGTTTNSLLVASNGYPLDLSRYAHGDLIEGPIDGFCPGGATTIGLLEVVDDGDMAMNEKVEQGNRSGMVRSVGVNCSQLFGSSPNRVTLLITPPIAAGPICTISTDPELTTVGNGLTLSPGRVALELTLEKHADVVRQLLYVVASGAGTLGVAETIEVVTF